MNLTDAFTADEIRAAVAALDNVANMPHHPMGPSSLYRVEQCPASMLGSLICSKANTATSDSRAGTRRHELFARMVRGETINIEEVEPEDISHLTMATLMFNTAIQRIESTGAKVVWKYAEASLSAPICGGIHGTADVILIDNHGRAFILDWKTGYAAEACDNATARQLALYALMLLSQNGYVNTVYASACYTETGTISARGPFIRDLLQKHLQDIEYSWIMATGSCPPFSHTTGDHCKYCSVLAAGRCPVVSGEAMTALASQSEELAQVANGPCDVATVAGADEFLERVRTIRQYLDPLEDAAKETIKLANGSERYRVVQVKGRETIDLKAAKAALGPDIVPFLKTGQPSCKIERRR